MSRSVSRTRVVLSVGAVAGVFALAGCGAGQITQTSTQVSSVDGASANVGQIAVRGAEFAFAGDGKSAVTYRTGGTAPLSMTIVNTGDQPDRLTAVSSPIAGSVKIAGNGMISGGKQLIVAGTPEPVPTPQAVATGSATRSGAAASAGATSAGATSVAASVAATQVVATPDLVTPSASPASPTTDGPATAAAAVSTAVVATPSPEGTTSAHVVFAGLKQDIQAGLTYPVVLTFQTAGDVTIQVPVGSPKESSSAQ